MNKYGQEITTLDDWADYAFRNGDYDEAEFLDDAADEWKTEVRELVDDRDGWERRADELAYGMGHIKNLLEDIRTDVQQASRLNRKDILDRLREAIQEFDEYI